MLLVTSKNALIKICTLNSKRKIKNLYKDLCYEYTTYEFFLLHFSHVTTEA